MVYTNQHTIAILAYNNHEITINNIEMLINDGNKNILLFDNGSEPSFEDFAKQKKLIYHRESKNIYVNPAWNKIFNMVSTKYLTLLNNDCYVLSKNYFHEILLHMDNDNIILSSCKTLNKKKIKIQNIKLYKKIYNYFYKKQLKYSIKARRQGWLMTLNLEEYKKLNYLIPNYIKIWYGDDWIWSQIIKNNRKYVVYKNRYALHLRNKTLSNSNIQNILNKDKKNMEEKGKDWVEKSIYIKSRLFNRYV
tara:strand:- start:3912 stop:4658 length:747 start_codon:yes stop_codon:yes gene_type:complete